MRQSLSGMESMGPLANPFDPSQGFTDEEDEKPYDPWEDEVSASRRKWRSRLRRIWISPRCAPRPRSRKAPRAGAQAIRS